MIKRLFCVGGGPIRRAKRDKKSTSRRTWKVKIPCRTMGVKAATYNFKRYQNDSE